MRGRVRTGDDGRRVSDRCGANVGRAGRSCPGFGPGFTAFVRRRGEATAVGTCHALLGGVGPEFAAPSGRGAKPGEGRHPSGAPGGVGPEFAALVRGARARGQNRALAKRKTCPQFAAGAGPARKCGHKPPARPTSRAGRARAVPAACSPLVSADGRVGRCLTGCPLRRRPAVPAPVAAFAVRLRARLRGPLRCPAPRTPISPGPTAHGGRVELEGAKRESRRTGDKPDWTGGAAPPRLCRLRLSTRLA